MGKERSGRERGSREVGREEGREEEEEVHSFHRTVLKFLCERKSFRTVDATLLDIITLPNPVPHLPLSNHAGRSKIGRYSQRVLTDGADRWRQQMVLTDAADK